jgi:hypothetical protein
MHITYAAIEKNWVHDIYPEAKIFCVHKSIYLFILKKYVVNYVAHSLN